jgi:hypothetical protein
MAGEWIPIDCNLGTKPEVIEIVAITGQPVEVVGWRLIQLWSWAALNTADGELRATPATIAMVCGGDEAFWKAVADVGWLTFEGSTCTIAGWEKRFSKAAKARANAAKRQDAFRKSRNSNAAPLRERDESVAVRNAPPSPQERRREEKREEENKSTPTPTSNGANTSAGSKSSSSSDFLSDDPRECWEAFRAAWEANKRAAPLSMPQTSIDPPRAYLDLWRSGDAQAALNALNQLAECRYFEQPISFAQFLNVWPKIEAGGYRERRGASTTSRPDDRPPPERWLDQYKPAEYRRPKEAVELAAKLKKADSI